MRFHNWPLPCMHRRAQSECCITHAVAEGRGPRRREQRCGSALRLCGSARSIRPSPTRREGLPRRRWPLMQISCCVRRAVTAAVSGGPAAWRSSVAAAGARRAPRRGLQQPYGARPPRGAAHAALPRCDGRERGLVLCACLLAACMSQGLTHTRWHCRRWRLWTCGVVVCSSSSMSGACPSMSCLSSDQLRATLAH